MTEDSSKERLEAELLPTEGDLGEYCSRHNIHLKPGDISKIRTTVAIILGVASDLTGLNDHYSPPDVRDRHSGRAPTHGEDPLNAIIRFCDVPGADGGPLSGKRVGVKDNVAVAGVPMTEGRKALTSLPAEDAVVVERLLGAGARIVAKTNLEVSDFGVTRNPIDPEFSAGGSSSGSAAAVASAMVDSAIGVDQGGSIRLPAAWCGIVGMTPTHGLVPSYGLAYCDHTLDTIGPMTASVADNAAMLEVIAGSDWRDPQWVRADPSPGEYLGAENLGIQGMRIGVVAEALEPAGCTADTLAGFERAIAALTGLGAIIETTSVSLWPRAPAIWVAVVAAGATAMSIAHGQGYGHLGRVDIGRLKQWVTQYECGLRSIPVGFGGTAATVAFEHIRKRQAGVPFGIAQNLRLALRAQIDSILGQVDLLVTPTSPTGPVELDSGTAEHDASAPSAFGKGSAMANTCPLNLGGHPALSLPVRYGTDFPVGFQLIGRRFDERTIYRAAFALESALS